MSFTFVDCNGLAGFMSLGFVQSGATMTARTGTLNFGNPIAELNRHHLGDGWDTVFSDDHCEWPDQNVDAIVGCPPCSGWSVWSGPANRGVDAAAHEHTRAFMRYAARVKPRAIIFECVQQAYTQGRDVMVQYRDMVEELSGKKYDLYHVKHNNLQVGGFSYRPRYFWVAVESGLPFGAHAATPAELPTLMDIIGDLETIDITWNAQTLPHRGSKFVAGLRRSDGLVDGHMNKTNVHAQRIKDIFDILGPDGWREGVGMDVALKEAVAKNGDKFPQNWLGLEEKIRRKNFDMGFSLPYRWKGESWANVLTGSALDHVVHPTQPRLITHREAARIQGLPDSWRFAEAQGYSALPAIWGKAVAVQAGRWIGEATKAALAGEPNGPQGELIGDREYLLDTDRGFSRQAVRKSHYPHL